MRAFLRSRWFLRLGLLIVLFLGLFLSREIFTSLRQSAEQPREIILEWPLPASLASKNRIPLYGEVEKVVVSGFFSDWSPSDENFRMSLVGPGRWSIRIPFEPGENQYKFVISIKGAATPFWTEDPLASRQVPDAFGGFNSVLLVPDFQEMSLFADLILGGLIAIVILYSVLDLFLAWILHRRLEFRYKLVFGMVFIVLLSSSTLVYLNLDQQREIVKQGLLDEINLIHLFLTSQGVDFSRLREEEFASTLQPVLDGFFASAKTRVEKGKTSNNQITISDLAILDGDFRMIFLAVRNENSSLKASRAEKAGFESLEHYFEFGVLAPLIERTKRMGAPEGLMTDTMPEAALEAETGQTRSFLPLLDFNTFLYPIKVRNKIAGFYAGDLQVKLYGAQIFQNLLFNIYTVFILTFLAALLLLNIGRRVTNYLQVLTHWTESILGGDYQAERLIPSQDEIQKLSENFNRMRIGLKENFEVIEGQNEQLRLLAFVDKLTGLANRKQLLDLLETRRTRGLILLNLDAFQEVNDFFSNEMGDHILIETGDRLKALLLPGEQKLFKIGSDEYVILWEKKLTHTELEDAGFRFCESVTEKSFRYLGNEIFISVTAGVAYDEQESGIEYTTSLLLAEADMALKRAKVSQKRVLFHDRSMTITHEYERNIVWTEKLRRALAEDRIVPYFQPIVNNRSGKIEKYEGLVRMIEPDGSVIAPAHFLRISKKARFYRFITKAMVEKVFQTFSDLPYEVAVNFSIEDVIDEKTVDYLFHKLEKNPGMASRFVLEIVETEGIENYQLMRDFIGRVRSFGCKIAIDDFGTGYSNFEHILQLQVDYLKIDGTLIKNLHSDAGTQIITRAISRFAEELKIQTIAEYVHSQQIQEKTLEYGIDFSQGYLFGEPKAWK